MNLPTKLTVLRLILSVFIIFILCFPFYLINVQFPVYYVAGVGMDLKFLILRNLICIPLHLHLNHI